MFEGLHHVQLAMPVGEEDEARRFFVDDIDTLADRLTAAGKQVRWDDEFPGFRRFHAEDPFANRLEFLQPE